MDPEPKRRAWAPYGILSLIFLVLAFKAVLDAMLTLLDPGAVPQPWSLSQLPALLRVYWIKPTFHNTYAMFYLLGALVAPLVLALTQRMPLRKGNWAKPLLVHVLASTLFVLPWFVGKLAFQPHPERWQRLGQLLTSPVSLTRLVFWCAPMYFLVVIYGQVVFFHEESRKHRLQASELERFLVEAQLQALKMKLQPHFLYNTLNTIQFLALAQDTGGITQVVDRLGRLLRMSMDSSGRQFVPLEEELAAVDLYLGIEELRFKDRLKVVRDIRPDVLRIQVPNLILQPLVENALKHGFSRRMEASLLEIRAWEESGRLRLSIRDDGPGLAPGWELSTGCGRGLKHVLERLDLLYPADHAFTLERAEGQGTLASLDLPMIESPVPSRAGVPHGAHQDRHRG